MKSDGFGIGLPTFTHDSSLITHHCIQTVALTGFVPIYSGGTARDLHPLPLPRSHIVEGTLGEREEGCQGHYCPSSSGLLMQPLPIYEKAPDQHCGEWPVRRWGSRTVRHQSAYRCCPRNQIYSHQRRIQANMLTAVSPIAELERENCPRQKQRDEIGDNDRPRM